MRKSARDLLERIEDGFARFEIEFGTRRKVLADRHQMFRLSKHYHEVRERYGRRFKPPEREMLPPDLVWGDDFLQYDGLKLISNSYNCDLFLRHHPMLSGIVATDLSTGKTMLKAQLPFDFWEFDVFQMRPFTKGDVTSLLQFLQGLGLFTTDRIDVEAAIQRIARENAWRPQD